MPSAGFTEPQVWHASLPGVVVAASALIMNKSGQLLIVKPNYRDFWTLPGGICEFGEPPHAGCSREVAEELGIDRPVGRLLAVDWQQALDIYGPDARPCMYFIFDGGTLATETHIELQAEELDDYRFVQHAEITDFLPPHMLGRAHTAVGALDAGITSYVPQP